MASKVIETQSVMMHHDTITGTSQQRVIDANRNIIWNALNENEFVLIDTLKSMLTAVLGQKNTINIDNTISLFASNSASARLLSRDRRAFNRGEKAKLS